MRVAHIENRLEQQLDLKDFVVNAFDNLTKGSDANVSTQRVNARLTALKETWERFSVIHHAINVAMTKVTFDEKVQLHRHSYFTNNIYTNTYEIYLDTIEKMTALSEHDSDSHHEIQSTSQTSSLPVYFHHARLPRIDIPKFNGSPSEWLSFKDLFSSLIISNPTLSAVEKLQYLKTSLIGSASHLLKNTSLTSDNFQKAWDSLISFYENKRLLVNAALHSLLSLKRMTKESAVEMEHLYTNLLQIYRTLETLNRPVHTWDDFLVFIATQRLDAESVKYWEQLLGSSKDPPSWNQFHDFLTTRLLSLQAFEKSRAGKSSNLSNQQVAKSHFQSKSKEGHSKKPSSCILCASAHYIANCPQYNSKLVPQRLAIINQHKLCFNCLGSHQASKCHITKRCIKCGKKHHTSIHQKYTTKNSTSELTSASHTPQDTGSQQSQAHVLHSVLQEKPTCSCVLLATAEVYIVSTNGETRKIRALIDQGSEISLISEHLVQSLHLPRCRSVISLIGTGKRPNQTRGSVTLTLKSHVNNFELSITAHILSRLTGLLPSFNVQKNNWSHFKGLTLADSNFTTPGKIDIILGAEVYAQILEDGLRKGDSKSPIAQRTKLGWIISGPANMSSPSNQTHGYHVSIDSDLHTLLKKFWTLEEVPNSTESLLSTEEQECERHFSTTHSRDPQGRYIVKLPFKRSTTTLGDSRAKALRVLTHLSRKFNNDSTYTKAYSDFLEEYERLEHMQRVDNSLPEPPVTYYLPHHGVIRENSLTTKLRVVFNGSSRTSTGVSLNDLLHIGAKQQKDVFDVLIWFRQFKYAFSSDIEKMYRQIKIHQDDWDFQRILWIEKDKTLSTYRLTTVTYGLACAPFLALRTIVQLAKDEGLKFPLAVTSLTNGRYVDDIFGGADSISQAQEVVNQLNSLCKAGGFPLQKWTSNRPEVLSFVPPERRVNTTSVHFEDSTIIHVLGLRWNSVLDTFQFEIQLSTSKIITKRTILSTISRIFDPLGLISPVIITSKILLQELWSIKLGWDDPLPAPTVNRWNQFITQFRDIPKLIFPRWIHFTSKDHLEIHGFSDASQSAICATVYTRTTSKEGCVETHLICSKTKVAPLKKMTIPRLELSGAVLLTKLVSRVLRILECQQIPIFLWTDSSIVLTWINNHPSRWKEFIHNRVCFIQETVPHAIWRFVPGTENPADCATRGMTPTQLLQHHIWWSGPDWLANDSSFWPKESQILSHQENLEEKPKQTFTTNAEPRRIWELIHKYSDLSKLLRVTALCTRAISRLRRKENSLTSTPISTQEIDNARTYWIRTIQGLFFDKEMKLLSNRQDLPRSNPFIRLTPFLDSQGLLRIGGRLRFSSLLPAAKHPLIIPRHSPLTSLIISDAHERTLHGGTQMTLTYIRNNYWIIGGRAPVRSFILKCFRCARYRQKRAEQLMGQLPPERVTPSRPFYNSGVDYAGPFLLKNWRGRNSRTYKGYIVLFICLATSAVHIELVTDCTTEAFIAAYKRFISRRGICATLMSDCGTNFKGADSEFRTLFSASSKELGQLASLLAKDGTQWKFIPPSTPHFGGKWEAGIKSVKYHLRRCIGNQLLTYEEMTTFLTQVEAVLNSRPLCSLSDDPDDLTALTPAHFLVGTTLTILPEPSLESIKVSHLSRWQLNRQMLESFWSRWSRECLQRYLSIYKWNRKPIPIKLGSLVLVVDERYPPSKWPLGRVCELHPGKDGLVRVVTVRTQVSILKRPIVKLCLLPIST